MKKLLYLLALVAGGVIFTSCNNNSQDPHNPFPWKPVSTTLNTNHEDVGKMCTADGAITEDNNKAEGIIFAVDGNTAYLCAFTDLMTPSRQGRTGLLWELAASVAWLRSNREAFGIDENKIVVCGFSAGGHLAGSLGVFWNSPFLAGLTGLLAKEMKPDRLILSYPVVTAGEFAHRGSFDNLLGKENRDTKKLAFLSLENQVTSSMPPAFLWHTFADDAVPVENTLLLAQAMRRAGVPFELHIFPKGIHGLGLADEMTDDGSGRLIVPECAAWPSLAADWIRREI